MSLLQLESGESNTHLTNWQETRYWDLICAFHILYFIFIRWKHNVLQGCSQCKLSREFVCFLKSSDFLEWYYFLFPLSCVQYDNRCTIFNGKNKKKKRDKHYTLLFIYVFIYLFPGYPIRITFACIYLIKWLTPLSETFQIPNRLFSGITYNQSIICSGLLLLEYEMLSFWWESPISMEG